MGIQKCVGESQQAVREGMGCEVSLGEWVDSVERKDTEHAVHFLHSCEHFKYFH